jgi:raffinose synthase
MSIHPKICLLVMLALGVPARAQISIIPQQGALQVQRSGEATLSDIHLYLKLSERIVSGGLQFANKVNGSDAAGKYELFRYQMVVESAEHIQATLEFRRYEKPEVLVATLDYEGPSLAATDSVQLGMQFNDFARGMALHRLKLWWLAPSFVSDPRLLAGANQLLLWQRMRESTYHLLVPLAGGGMVGELKVSDIDKFRVSFSSHDPNFTAHRIPLFAYASGDIPHKLAPAAYAAAFAANSYFGRLRWQKPFPEVFQSLGWCSWNTYYDTVTEEKVLDSVRSLRGHKIPLGFVLIDEGWRIANGQKLAAYGADPIKFPHGLAGLARTLHEDYHIPYVGVWHVFQGYWQGVDPDSEIGLNHALFAGNDGQYLPDPRGGAGESFYEDWYKYLASSGIDFIKVDNQASTPKFTNGLLPIFDASAGEQQNLQNAALRYLSSKMDRSGTTQCVKVLNCMEMSLENAFNWRYSNVARNSEDYDPTSQGDKKDHIFWNAYNAYWTANFAYPDWDMFETRRDDGEFQAIARAISGGPIYTTDSPGKEDPERLLPLAFSDGRLLLLDEPGMVTADLLLTDTSMEPVPLKVFGTITRPGLKAGMLAVFNVNKAAQSESGTLRIQDVPELIDESHRESERGKQGFSLGDKGVAVYQRSTGSITVLDFRHSEIPVKLGEFGHDLFTLVPVDQDIAIFGSLDKYLSPAAIESVQRLGTNVKVRLLEPGEFGAFLQKPPRLLKVDRKTLPSSAYRYSGHLLRIPKGSFDASLHDHEVEIVLSK